MTGELGTLRNLAAAHRQVHVLQRMLAHHITKFPLQPEAGDTSENLLFNLLGFSPLSYAEDIQENYRVHVHTQHPDKTEMHKLQQANSFHPKKKPNKSSSTQYSKTFTLVVDFLASNEAE